MVTSLNTNSTNYDSSTSSRVPQSIATTTTDKQVTLGPGQIQPKGYRLSSMRYGELKLGFIMNKGMFEVEVSYIAIYIYCQKYLF